MDNIKSNNLETGAQDNDSINEQVMEKPLDIFKPVVELQHLLDGCLARVDMEKHSMTLSTQDVSPVKLALYPRALKAPKYS